MKPIQHIEVIAIPLSDSAGQSWEAFENAFAERFRTIEKGDFIKSSSGLLGFMLERGTIQFGRRDIPVYLVERADGKEDVIFVDDAMLLAKSQQYWQEREDYLKGITDEHTDGATAAC